MLRLIVRIIFHFADIVSLITYPFRGHNINVKLSKPNNMKFDFKFCSMQNIKTWPPICCSQDFHLVKIQDKYNFEYFRNLNKFIILIHYVKLVVDYFVNDHLSIEEKISIIIYKWSNSESWPKPLIIYDRKDFQPS